MHLIVRRGISRAWMSLHGHTVHFRDLRMSRSTCRRSAAGQARARAIASFADLLAELIRLILAHAGVLLHSLFCRQRDVPLDKTNADATEIGEQWPIAVLQSRDIRSVSAGHSAIGATAVICGRNLTTGCAAHVGASHLCLVTTGRERIHERDWLRCLGSGMRSVARDAVGSTRHEHAASSMQSADS